MTPTPLIVFTGHRDRTAPECDLRSIASQYGGHTWVHGGARGFDSQVETLARRWGIPTIVVRPDYKKYPHPGQAPLLRNGQMLKMPGVMLVVACWDGRRWGGTAYTVREAQDMGLRVAVVDAVRG